MKVIKTGIEGLLILEPKIFEDKRGYFFESYNETKYREAGITNRWVQDNQSKSGFGVIRGLHMQNEPFAQAKLIRVLEGSIFDVAVDMRKGSPTFGQWYGHEISEENRIQMLIPKGFCHGFSVTSKTATVLYKCDEVYHPEAESGIHYNDPDLNIDWKIPSSDISVSEKDKKLPFLKDKISGTNA
jgi:dTDP-4-dehydrorhamnose 3,5-epimerase